MRMLVVSDNHFDRDILVQVDNKYYNKVDLMFHCGDSQLPASDSLFEHFLTVQGNNDFDEKLPQSRLIKQSGEQVLLTHGHLQDVNSTMTKLELMAQEKNATIVLFGHTHKLGVVMNRGALFLNPGSISLPRGEFTSIGGTYAIVDVTAAKFVVQFYDRQFKAIKELSFTFQR
ncbi:phosphodiesterase [Paucilactobacillus hokkaidonensis JCM 18461]|uniref:Phosphoesterase n=2 Tax=Paucilactobacillus hokkaidonensis TaxID=1193095 RepID=A0A0A1GYI5_9LACO|nr:metallophosphoesterase [Paucilactobacillus hokkaidonensis]BAP86028.1 phosphodiesterase [Paucilactobacillus hokkaidonensis JCM 18461]